MATEKLTGKTIKITDEKLETLATYNKEQSQIHAMITHLSVRLEKNSRSMWCAVRDLWPELHDYDLIIDQEKQEIRVRHELSDWEKTHQNK